MRYLQQDAVAAAAASARAAAAAAVAAWRSQAVHRVQEHS